MTEIMVTLDLIAQKKVIAPNIIGVEGEVCDKPVNLPDSHRLGLGVKYFDADGGFTGKYVYNCLDKCPEGEADAWIYTPINIQNVSIGQTGVYCSAGNPLIEATEDRVCTYHKANPIPKGSTFYPNCTTILMHYIENKSSVNWELLRQRKQGIALANYKETPVAGGTDIIGSISRLLIPTQIRRTLVLVCIMFLV